MAIIIEFGDYTPSIGATIESQASPQYKRKSAQRDLVPRLYTIDTVRISGYDMRLVRAAVQTCGK